MPNRRRTLQTLVALPVLGQQQHQHDEPLKTKVPPYRAKVFSAGELAALAKLTEIIIPRTDTPGAADAGVPLLIDGSASRNAAFGKRWQEALAWFARQGEPSALIARISKENGTEGARYFKLLKDTTIDHYYATREGLQQELGWNANTYLAEFQGCTHPEHQA